MPRKDSRNTKMKIVNAAWELFYENGYENTTIEDIVERSETSKGSFYHHFSGKDALLSTLSYLFDDKYEALEGGIDFDGDAFQTLLDLNKELFFMIENRVSLDLLARMFSTIFGTFISLSFSRVFNNFVSEYNSLFTLSASVTPSV